MDIKFFENLMCGFFGLFLACVAYFMWILWQAGRRPQKTSKVEGYQPVNPAIPRGYCQGYRWLSNRDRGKK